MSAETALIVSSIHAGLSQILSFSSCQQHKNMFWKRKKLETAASAVPTAENLSGIS